MSRVGKRPITLPQGVTATLQEQVLTVKGPKGTLSRTIHPKVDVEIDAQSISVKRRDDTKRGPRALDLNKGGWADNRRLFFRRRRGIGRGFLGGLLLIRLTLTFFLIFFFGSSHSEAVAGDPFGRDRRQRQGMADTS